MSNPRMNVLITSASRKVSLVRAFQSSLGRCGGGNVVAVDVNPYAPALYVADRYFLVPRSADPKFLDKLVAICEQENVRLLIPTRDEELQLFAGNRDLFEQLGVCVMVAPCDVLRICQDKQLFLDFCQQRGFDIPKTYTGEQLQTAEFPLFAKPRVGKGGKGAARIGNEAELRTLVDSPDEWIIQELVVAPEYTVDLLADFKGRVLSAVPRSRQFVLAGESYVSRTVNEPKIIEESVRLASEMGLVGHNTIQCFWNGQQVKFIEINPRFGGAAALGIAAGADTPTMLLQMIAGKPVSPQLGEFQRDLVMLRFTNDLFLRSDALAGDPPRLPAARDAGLRAVLFDLDNTLYAEEQFVQSGFRAAAACLALHEGLDADILLERMLDILRTNGRGKVFDILLRELKLDSGTWLHTLLVIYRSHRPSLALPKDTHALLTELRGLGVKSAIVTDGLASVQRAKIAALGLEQHMDAIVCTGELPGDCGKPSTVPFEVALKLLGVPPGGAAYVADDITKDFAGPNRLGMKTVRLRSAGLVGVPQQDITDPISQPFAEAGSMNEVLNILQTICK